MYKIISIIGARPHYMKLAPIVYELKNYPNISHKIVDSGQHYDNNLSADFLEEFKLPSLDYLLNVGSGTPTYQMGEIIKSLGPIFEKEKPDMVIVYGDTNTTAAGAISAAKMNIPIAHVEAGLREWDKSIPEEVNKLLTDAITDLYFCPTKSAIENLKKQGIIQNVILSGDVTLDLLKSSQIKSKTETLSLFDIPEKYHLFTCHRASNLDNGENISEIVQFLNETSEYIIWPMHPRAKKVLYNSGLTIVSGNVKLISPISYWDTQSLIKHAKSVITDSGGIIKEAYFHKTPAIIIDQQTEWIEAINEGWHRIAGPNHKRIQKMINELPNPKKHTMAFGNGEASKIIVKEILNWLK